MTLPSHCPTIAPPGHMMAIAAPMSRNACHFARGLCPVREIAVDSSLIQWEAMRARQSCGKKGPTATPKAKLREFTRRPASTARIGAPPAAMTPTKVNSAAPPRANIASSRVCHQAKPETAEIAPYDSATAMIVMVTMATAR